MHRLLPNIRNVFDIASTVTQVQQALKRDSWAGEIAGMQTRCQFVEQMEDLPREAASRFL